jgi:hypothetical protein
MPLKAMAPSERYLHHDRAEQPTDARSTQGLQAEHRNQNQDRALHSKMHCSHFPQT